MSRRAISRHAVRCRFFSSGARHWRFRFPTAGENKESRQDWCCEDDFFHFDLSSKLEITFFGWPRCRKWLVFERPNIVVGLPGLLLFSLLLKHVSIRSGRL